MKTKIREMRAHYGQRWTAFKQNRKSENKVLLLEDRVTLDFLYDGTACFYDCLGSMYQHLSLDYHTEFQNIVYDNVVLINNLEFKYKKIDQLIDRLTFFGERAEKRLIVWLSFKYLIFDRVDMTVDDVAKKLVVPDFELIHFQNLIFKHDRGFGDLFFVYERNNP